MIRMLTFGNSFADNISAYLPQIMLGANDDILIGRANIGGCPFDKHWRLAQIHEADPTDPEGMPYYNPQTDERNLGLKEALVMDKWDFVTIQQFSWISNDIATYQPYAGYLRDYAKKYAPQVEVIMHETWAYRKDDPRFDGVNDSMDIMYKDLSAAYKAVAAELNIRVVPVGDAFQIASNDPEFIYTPDPNYNFTNPVFPELPDQKNSLHAGYYWRKNEETSEYCLEMDGHHANRTGEYLGGLVFCGFLTGKSPVGNTFKPEWLTDVEIATLQKAAEKALNSL
ncbi:MAG: DUF4886 domain-containing protein [bacterium]